MNTARQSRAVSARGDRRSRLTRPTRDATARGPARDAGSAGHGPTRPGSVRHARRTSDTKSPPPVAPTVQRSPVPPAADPFPSAVRPVPARAVVQLDTPGTHSAGTRVTVDGAAVEFRTAIDAVVPPIRLRHVGRLGDGRLRLTFAAPGPAGPLALPPRIDTQPAPFGLRLFVPDPGHFRSLTATPVTAHVNGATVADAIRPAGFDLADATLPADPHEPEAVRLLAAFAAFPEAFRFVDLLGLSPAVIGSTVGDLHVDLIVPGTAVPTVLLGCVPAVNRWTAELPPIPMRGDAAVRLDVDPLADAGDRRVVVDVLRVRAVRGGRTVTRYADDRGVRPPSTGTWSLDRRGAAAWLTVAGRSPQPAGRTLLVTATCCRPALPVGDVAWAAGVRPVTPVRPPLWPGSADLTPDVVRHLDQLVTAVAAAFGSVITVDRCEAVPVRLPRTAGVAHGTEVRLTIAAADDAYGLARVLDVAVGTAAPVDGFTRAVVGGVWTGPPRSGKSPPFSDGPEGRASSREDARPSGPSLNGGGGPPSATALAGVLRHALGVPVTVTPLWPVAVPATDPARLGAGGRTLGRRQPAWGVRVVLGPLDRRAIERLSPGAPSGRRLRQRLATALGTVPVVVDLLPNADARWQLGTGRLGRSTALKANCTMKGE